MTSDFDGFLDAGCCSRRGARRPGPPEWQAAGVIAARVGCLTRTDGSATVAHMTRARAAAATVLLAVALGLSGCASGDPSDQGPLSLGGVGSSSLECIPAGDGQAITFGVVATNRSASFAAQLVDATLVDARGVEVVDAVAIPLGANSHYAYGAMGYPPAPSHGVRWSDRVAIGGEVVRPHEDVNIVFAMRLLDRTTVGSARAVRIDYKLAGRGGFSTTGSEGVRLQPSVCK